jgi:hypothetical protein
MPLLIFNIIRAARNIRKFANSLLDKDCFYPDAQHFGATNGKRCLKQSVSSLQI